MNAVGNWSLQMPGFNLPLNDFPEVREAPFTRDDLAFTDEYRQMCLAGLFRGSQMPWIRNILNMVLSSKKWIEFYFVC